MADTEPTELHKLAYQSNWNELVARLETHPAEASQTVNDSSWIPQGIGIWEDHAIMEATNVAPIHILCTRQGVPLNVIEAYVRVQPTSVYLLTGEKRCPLHLACYSKNSLEIIRFLAQVEPQTILMQESFYGWNAFHICTHSNVREDVLSMLINVVGPDRTAAALGSKDLKGRTPIVLACRSQPKITKKYFTLLHQESGLDNLKHTLLEEISRNYGSFLTGALKLKPPPASVVSTENPSHYCNPKRSISVESFWLWRPQDSFTLWECMHKIIVLLGVTNDSQLPTYPLLHECLREDKRCRTVMFDCILSLNPHYVCQVDSNGDLPIHVAARLAENTKEWKNRLKMLVNCYPKGASIVNDEGKLPLELLRQVSWGHMSPLIRCCPLALSRLHIHDALYANVLAKLGQTGVSNTVLTILKETPSLFQGK
jgi:hypothetical protein